MQKEPAGQRGVYAQLWSLLRGYRWGLALMLGADALALIAVTLTPITLAALIDGPIARRNADGMWPYIWTLLVLAVAQSILYFIRRLPNLPMIDLATTMRRDLFRHVQRLSPRFHGRNGSGVVISRLIGDIDRITDALTLNFAFLVHSALSLAMAATMLIAIQPLLGILTVVGLVPLSLLSQRFRTQLIDVAQDARERAGDLATVVEEFAHGFRSLKSFGAFEYIEGRFAGASHRSLEAELRTTRVDALFNAIVSAYPVVLLPLVVVFGAIQVVDGGMSIGAFLAFLTFYFQLLLPVTALGQTYAIHQQAIAACKRIFDLHSTMPEVADPDSPKTLPADGPLGVTLEHVRFGHPDATAPILSDVHVDVSPGEILAVIGRTGSGKSMLASLLGRLDDVTGGSIRIGGHDLRDLAVSEVREAVGVSFQDASLFSTSLRENLLLGRTGIGHPELATALDLAQAGFVSTLPAGLDTQMGERGLTLSGGQRQRIALARTLLARPRVLVLDEPTSALDLRTSQALESQLKAVVGGKVTTIILSQRASIAQMADRVALLDEGRILDVGSHDDLWERSLLYRAVLTGESADQGKQ